MKSTTPRVESLLVIIESQAETIKQLQAKIAERELCGMKCKQKISGGFRAQQGADVFARI